MPFFVQQKLARDVRRPRRFISRRLANLAFVVRVVKGTQQAHFFFYSL